MFHIYKYIKKLKYDDILLRNEYENIEKNSTFFFYHKAQASVIITYKMEILRKKRLMNY